MSQALLKTTRQKLYPTKRKVETTKGKNMATQSTYEHDEGQRLTVFYPTKAAPFVPQSCFAFGARRHVEMCRSINDTSKGIFDTCMLAGRGDEYAADIAADLVDTLVCDLGFTRTSTGTI